MMKRWRAASALRTSPRERTIDFSERSRPARRRSSASLPLSIVMASSTLLLLGEEWLACGGLQVQPKVVGVVGSQRARWFRHLVWLLPLEADLTARCSLVARASLVSRATDSTATRVHIARLTGVGSRRYVW